MAHNAASELPETLSGRFRLLERLASGGSGEVFVALDQSTQKEVALKRLLPSNNKASSISFMREFYALSALRHPRIIEVYDYGVDGAPYYTMELLRGADLSELGALPYREACRYLCDVASSLALLHARRALHRDVSPRNIKRTSDGRCKLIDFGAMMPFGTPPNVQGTPPCLAPEALQGGPLDQTSDLYSLGAVAYFLLTGRHAFPARELSGLPGLWRAGIPPLRAAGEIPPALEGLVMSLLNLDRARRPTSAAEVIERLSGIAGLTPESEDDLAVGRSVLASTPMLGQSHQRAQISDRLQRTKTGSGGAFLITGAVGSGRTRMLNEAGLSAQTCGVATVRLLLREQRGVSSSLLRDLINGLKQVVPEAAERASVRWPLLRADAGNAPRTELLRQVEAYVSEIAQRQPLLLTFDDVQYGSDDDFALIAALAQISSTRPMCIIASERSSKGHSRLSQLSAFASPLVLKPLGRTQIAMLTGALFGDVPNLQSLSEFFYRNAEGNPKLTLELAEHLLARRILRYTAGHWVLPDVITEPVPRDIAQSLMLRLESVSQDARRLASLLCVRRGGARIDQVLEVAAPLRDEQVFRALEDLVSAGVLQSAGDEYVFTQDALRVELGRGLSTDEASQLHMRWADYLLAHASTDDARLEAGWHLVHTKHELRGAELLADVAPKLVERRVSMATAIPAIERALQVYECHGKSLQTRLYLRALLVMSSYLYDYRLADRYGDDTLSLLYPYTGLREAEVCARWVGRSAGFVLGVSWVTLRWLFSPSRSRGPHVVAALKYYVQSTMGLIGLRAILTEDTQVVLDRMRGFRDAPHPLLALAYVMAEAIHLHGIGRGADVHRSIERARTQLDRTGTWQLSEHERLDLKIGLLLLEGMNENWRERSRTFACADELEAIDTPLARAAALRVRMCYHLLRDEQAEAQHYRKMLELQALESGGFWQVQMFAVPLEGSAAGTWSDLVGLRRALERLDQLIVDAPGLATTRDGLWVTYHFRRGEYQTAATLGEEFMRKVPPMTRIGWPMNYAIVALAHAHIGQGQRALEICESAFTHVTAADREYSVLYAPLEAAYATALALTGQLEKSKQLFRDRIERLYAVGDYQRAIVMHHYRLALARLMGDDEMLHMAHADMFKTAAESGNPAALALAQRLSEDQRAESKLPPVLDDPPDADTAELLLSRTRETG